MLSDVAWSLKMVNKVSSQASVSSRSSRLLNFFFLKRKVTAFKKFVSVCFVYHSE